MTERDSATNPGGLEGSLPNGLQVDVATNDKFKTELPNHWGASPQTPRNNPPGITPPE